LPIAQQVSEQCSTHSATPQHAAPGQCAHKVLLLAFAFAVVFFAFVCCLEFALRAEEMGKYRPSHAATTQHPAPNQRTQKLLLFSFAFFTHIAFLVVALGVELASGSQQVGEERPAHSPTSQQATREECPHELILVAGALLSSFVRLIAVMRLAVLANEAREKRTTDTPILQRTTAQGKSGKLFRFGGGGTHRVSLFVVSVSQA
jgi:hypothetical protein